MLPLSPRLRSLVALRAASLLAVSSCLTLLPSTSRAQSLDPEPCACDVRPDGCDPGCACDPACSYTGAVDECAESSAGCVAELPDDQLDGAESASAPTDPAADAMDDASGGALVCPDGAQDVGGHCKDGIANDVSGGCKAAPGPLAAVEMALLVGAALLATRRRRAAIALLVAAAGCVASEGSWDDAIAEDPPTDAAGRFLDVRIAPHAALSDGSDDGILARIDGQPLGAGAGAPGDPTFSLERSHIDGAVAIRRTDGECGDRLVAGGRPGDGDLLGWAATTGYDGTAPLVELAAPEGCARRYETDAATIDLYVAEGWSRGATLGYVWPPRWGAAADADERATTTAPSLPVCKLGKSPALTLFYQFSTKRDVLTRLFAGCPGEVVMGEKAWDHPHGNLRGPEAHAAGGRTSFILGANGQEIRTLLLRPNGVERTAAFFRGLLKSGYDYIVIDEITTDPTWADGADLNRRFRKMLLRVPPRTVIGYVSLDLTMYPNGFSSMKQRRQLLRALKLRGRALALETYLHTDAVMNGAAPSTFRTAAARVALAVHGMKQVAGISRREITTLGLSMHTKFAQYNYLDDARHDLASIGRQVTAIRHASGRTAAQRGIGFYFLGTGDITPSAHAGYSVDDVIAKIHASMLRFK